MNNRKIAYVMKMVSRLILIATLTCFLKVQAGKEGTSFFIVGDYGVVTNLTQADGVFDAINRVVG